jgi:LTXXQ motif family protein
MRARQKFLLGAVLLSTLVTWAGSAQAQQMQHGAGMMGGCPMMGGQGMMGQMPMGGMGPGMMMTGPAVEGRLAYLKAEFGITEAQMTAWDGYVTVVKARMLAMPGMHQTMIQAGTAITRLDAHTKAMESMVETLKSLKPATEALYAVLTPKQKTKADQLLGMGCCMM